MLLYLFGGYPKGIEQFDNSFLNTREKHSRRSYVWTLDSSRHNRDNFDSEIESNRLNGWLKHISLPHIIAATKQDRDNALPLDDLRELYAIPDEIPIYPVSATTDPNSVRRAIIGLLEIMPQDEIIQRAITGLRKLELGRSS